MVRGQPGQKVSKTPFQPKSQSWWCASVIPVRQEAKGRRIMVLGQPREKLNSLPEKQLKTKKGWCCLSGSVSGSECTIQVPPRRRRKRREKGRGRGRRRTS
jgi:hypothetical protein